MNRNKVTKGNGSIVNKTGTLMVAILLSASVTGTACAAGGSPDPTPAWPTDPVIDRATKLFEGRDFKGAATVMQQAVASNPQNPEYHNMFAYYVRKGASPDMDLVFKHYNEALRLRPDYRGAHEYIGEAYLMVDNLPKAKEHLSVLDRLCTFGCEEYTDLKRAVATYEAKKR